MLVQEQRLCQVPASERSWLGKEDSYAIIDFNTLQK